MNPTIISNRPNKAKATIVNAGIIIAGIDGRRAAALFLERAGVPLAVIARVLSDPANRRPSP